MAAYSDRRWVHAELIPFLNLIFPARSTMQWEKLIARAEIDIDKIPFFEDFPFTIECLRLSLINPSVLTQVEEKKFSVFRNNPQLCIEVFVRHAIRQRAWYPLHSLGHALSRDFPRPQATKSEDQRPQENHIMLSDQLEAKKTRGGEPEFANISKREARKRRLTMSGEGENRAARGNPRFGHSMGVTNYNGFAAYSRRNWERNRGPGLFNTHVHGSSPALPSSYSFRPFGYPPPSNASLQGGAAASMPTVDPALLRGDANEFLPGAVVHRVV